MSTNAPSRDRPNVAPSIPEKSEPASFNVEIGRQLDSLERHLDDLQRQVQQLQRMASIGTMSAILAHEFNNLLTPILTYTQYALTRDDPELLRTAVDKTHKNATRLAALSQRILGLATGAPGGLSEIAVKPLLIEAVASLGRDFEKDGIVVEISAAEGLTILADAGAMQQVLFNLVINAWQAMLDRAGALSLSARVSGNSDVEIRVQDGGVGIPLELQSRIFEPFFSTKTDESRSYRRGAGLGLHVCRQLIEAQGGTIRVESKPGLGATFIMTLPRGGSQPPAH